MNSILPTYFLSHGGGPWPFMKEQYGTTYDVLEASLVDVRRQIEVPPKAVLVVSSHWEEHEFMLSSGAKPGMIYDYGGFPSHTYQIVYPAPGAPDLAQRAANLIAASGHQVSLDPTRGFDHGTVSMLYPIYPNAGVPVVPPPPPGLPAVWTMSHLSSTRPLPASTKKCISVGSPLAFWPLKTTS